MPAREGRELPGPCARRSSFDAQGKDQPSFQKASYNAWRRWLARLAITQRLVDGFGKSDIVEPDAVRPGVEQDCFYIVELTGTAAALKMLDCFRKNGTLLETWMPKAVQIPTRGVGTCSKDARRAMLKRQRADWRNRGNAAAKALRLRYHGEI